MALSHASPSKPPLQFSSSTVTLSSQQPIQQLDETASLTNLLLDIHVIKQELHDALGEEGLPYWKAMNAYLVGQLGRGELESMVRGCLKSGQLHLHNKLLISLLTNAAIPPHESSSSASQRKRKRMSVSHPDYDTDDTLIEDKRRVERWVMSLGKKERARVKKAMAGTTETGGTTIVGDGKDAWESMEAKRWSPYSSNTLIPPLALPKRQLPSSHQLALRLSQFAKMHDLAIATHATDDIGEFMAIGMDAHMGDVLHGVVHLTGRDRPGNSTIRVRKDINPSSREVDSETSASSDIPAPDLETMRSLFTLHPSLHSNLSPSLHRLMSSQTLAEIEAVDPALQPSPRMAQGMTLSESTPTAALLSANDLESRMINKPPPSKSLVVSNELVEYGLLKLDKAGREGDEGKKERRHNLHWKYEDPAIILGDVLG
ncbi:hypothetical protein L204_103560 [Cryptococcus depauperatus]